MRIAVSGGGNIGTCFAAHMAECGHEVTVHTSKPELFSDTLFVEAGESGSVIHKGRIRGAFKDPKEAFSEADLVFLTVPAFLFEERLSEMKPYLKQDAAVFFVPGSGGGEGFARKLTGEKRTVFGLQRVPAIARLKEYGKTVVCTGYRRELAVSAMPISEAGKAKELMEELFQIPCRILPNFLNLTLTPSNPILHTARIYRLYKDHKPGDPFPLFYEDWDDPSSRILLRMDGELQEICRNLPEFDLSGVKSLKEHYESRSEAELTEKLSHIPAFRGLPTPGKDSRYFSADFGFGLSILLQIAELTGTKADMMREVYAWYRSFLPGQKEFQFRSVGIGTREELVSFYG